MSLQTANSTAARAAAIHVATGSDAAGRRRSGVGLRRAAVWGSTFACVLAAGVLGLCVGGQAASVAEIARALVGDGDTRTQAMVWEVRLPRTLAAAVAGCGLGLAASLLQTLTRNPVADAGLLGSNAGATVVVALGMAGGLAANALERGVWAMGGALIATAFVCVVGLSGRVHSIARLVLLGVALSAVLMGITNGIMLAVPAAFDGMRHWLAGSTVGVPFASTGIAALTVCVALAAAAAIAQHLELTRLGDDSARALGVRIGVTRSIAVVSIALACSAATALVGPLTFVGLLAAHAANWIAERMRIGAAERHLLAGCGGVVLLVYADVIGRVVLWPGELPAGIVVAIIGAPVLLGIVRGARRIS